MIAEHKHLVSQGAKLVELRLDYISGEINLKRLLNDRPSPVVITCRRERDGGKWAGTEEQRLMLMRTAIAEGVDYVDLEDDIAETGGYGWPRWPATWVNRWCCARWHAGRLAAGCDHADRHAAGRCATVPLSLPRRAPRASGSRATPILRWRPECGV